MGATEIVTGQLIKVNRTWWCSRGDVSRSLNDGPGRVSCASDLMCGTRRASEASYCQLASLTHTLDPMQICPDCGNEGAR